MNEELRESKIKELIMLNEICKKCQKWDIDGDHCFAESTDQCAKADSILSLLPVQGMVRPENPYPEQIYDGNSLDKIRDWDWEAFEVGISATLATGCEMVKAKLPVNPYPQFLQLDFGVSSSEQIEYEIWEGYQKCLSDLATANPEGLFTLKRKEKK